MLSAADILRIIDCIVEACHPEHVYVFGSYALGTAHRGSDLDLLVVQQSRLPRHRRGLRARSMLASVPVDVDLVFVTPVEMREELVRPASIVSAIVPSAKLVYSRTAPLAMTAGAVPGQAEQ